MGAALIFLITVYTSARWYSRPIAPSEPISREDRDMLAIAGVLMVAAMLLIGAAVWMRLI